MITPTLSTALRSAQEQSNQRTTRPQGDVMTAEMEAAIKQATFEVGLSLSQAIVAHGPMHSAHEAYAVILEELDEVKAVVWRKDLDYTALRAELRHVAAMAIRAIIDLEPKVPA